MNPMLIDKSLTIALIVVEYLMARPEKLAAVNDALKRMEAEGRKDITPEDVEYAINELDESYAQWREAIGKPIA